MKKLSGKTKFVFSVVSKNFKLQLAETLGSKWKTNIGFPQWFLYLINGQSCALVWIRLGDWLLCLILFLNHPECNLTSKLLKLYSILTYQQFMIKLIEFVFLFSSQQQRSSMANKEGEVIVLSSVLSPQDLGRLQYKRKN